ncbi:hypothetical protein [Nocardia sp. NBC_01009]|uniref:hypothetical protein n=1 Tax=Nocardia sp. NBC_01009 TaxID=2975996 RepID=UPI0038680765|nr:hypothetical protein OHA42_29530 [Nocardia sp. NBC_01009]
MPGSGNFRPFREVLAELDAAFAQAKRPTRIDACPCCTTTEEVAVLLSKPRKMLGADDLQHYATSSMTTMGSAADLRYFTPRILELCHTGALNWPDIEIVYDHLRRADWKSWPEAGVIAELLDALWDDVLTEYPAFEDPAALLCALGRAADSVAPYLTSWSRLETSAAIHHLRDFLIDDVALRHGALVPTNAFWDPNGNPHSEVVRWLNSKGTRQAIDRAFTRTTDAELLELLAESHDVLTVVDADSRPKPGRPSVRADPEAGDASRRPTHADDRPTNNDLRQEADLRRATGGSAALNVEAHGLPTPWV